MKFALAFVALSVPALLATQLSDEIALFADFKMTYGKAYGPTEEAKRLSCFRANLVEAARLNKMDSSAHYGINQFADLCADEFKAFYHPLTVPTNKTRNELPRMAAPTAGSVDWRTKGAVTPVKNQGQCGSCWSFSATGNMEGQWMLAGNTLVGLSEEELVQCSASAGNQGCQGGLMDDAFEWVVKNGGIDSESDYPYTSGTGITGTCKSAKLKNIVAKFSGHKDIAKDETQMASFVEASGPLAVAVDAGLGWQTYVGGIKKSCYAGQLDHGVMIVGYGTEGSTDYWIVKNSWGASWGESGYIRLHRGVNCNGIDESASSATA